MAMPRIAPKSLLCDLLRVTPQAIPVRRLVEVGALFGLEDNAIRVALARLVAAGRVASDQRGHYRFAAGAGALSTWVESWRLGDRRIRRWRGDWLCAHVARGGERGEQAQRRRALEHLGLRCGLDGVWLRPDNLRAPRAALEAVLAERGVAQGVVWFTASGVAPTVAQRWVRLWSLARLQVTWHEALADLARSRDRLDRLPTGRRLVESFAVGGRAIRVLALDPLLPDEIVGGDGRRRLGAAMLEYDALGKAIWSAYLETTRLERSPRDTTFAATAA
jgi:phenylacetic acid degradation operon negative regulatory protein